MACRSGLNFLQDIFFRLKTAKFTTLLTYTKVYFSDHKKSLWRLKTQSYGSNGHKEVAERLIHD